MIIFKLAHALFLLHAAILIVVCLFITYLLIIIGLYILPKSLIEKMRRFVRKILYHLANGLLCFVFGRPIVLSYDTRMIKKKNALFCSNHISEYDWFFIMLILRHFNKLMDLRIIIKKSLKKIPFLGKILDFCENKFLSRNNRKKDLSVLKRMSKSLEKVSSYIILLFAEGTYIMEESLEESAKYAQNKQMLHNGIPYIPKNILIPKKTGFNILRKTSNCSVVADVTLFTNPFCLIDVVNQSHFDFLFLRKNNFIPFIRISMRPSNLIDENYLLSSFMRKDEIIEKYVLLHKKQTIGIDETKAFLMETYHSNDDRHYQKIEVITTSKTLAVFIILLYAAIYITFLLNYFKYL